MSVVGQHETVQEHQRPLITRCQVCFIDYVGINKLPSRQPHHKPEKFQAVLSILNVARRNFMPCQAGSRRQSQI